MMLPHDPYYHLVDVDDALLVADYHGNEDTAVAVSDVAGIVVGKRMRMMMTVTTVLQ